MVADDPTAVTDVKRLYEFLLRSEELRTSSVRDLDGARRILWLGDLPEDEPGVVSGLTDPYAGETWLAMDRVLRYPPPAPPEALEPWLDRDQIRDPDRTEAPALLDEPLPPAAHRHPRPTPTAQPRHDGDRAAPDSDTTAPDDPEHLRTLHATWAEFWLLWAEREPRVAPLARIYETLFTIHQEAADLGDTHELVLAVGYLTWTADDQPVRRHLVTRRVSLAMDDRGRISLVPDPEASGYVLEEDMLEAAQRLTETARARVLEHLAEAGASTGPEGAGHLHAALRDWATSAEAGAYYDETLHRHTADDHPGRAHVGYAPALILRPRRQRGQVNALREIVAALDGAGAATTPLLRHITGAATEPEPVSPGGEQIHFPLETNAEQRLIAERLRRSELVVVQGPPGTGKTHTIANLVTDLLARGRRVLITSQTTRALRVLRDKLPEEIRPLAVSRTGDGAEAQRELESSVRAILERQAAHEPADADAEITRLQARLDAASRERDEALGDLRAIRERETHRHPRRTGDYEGTLSAIAARLADEEDRHSWIGHVPAETPAIGAADALALLAAARAYTDEDRALAASVPPADSLPKPSRYAAALATIARAREAADRAAGSWGGDLDDLITGMGRKDRADLRARVDAFTTARDVAARLAPRWGDPRADVLRGRDRKVLLQARTAADLLDRAERELDRIGGVRFDGLDAFTLTDALRHVTALTEGFEAGRRLTGPFGIRTRLFKENAVFLQAAAIDGSPLDTEDELRMVRHRVHAERHLSEAERTLDGSDHAWQDPALRLADLRETLDDLHRLVELSRARTELVRFTDTLPGLAGVDWTDTTRVDAIALILAAVDADHAAVPERRLVADALDTLRAWADLPEPEPAALRRARTAVEAADPDAYAEACVGLERVREAARRRDERDTALARVREGHPDLADRVAADPHRTHWDTRLPDLEDAWAWSVWNRRLAELTDPAAEERCRTRLDAADHEVRSTLGGLAAAKAWRACLGRLTHAQEVALASYQRSIRRIGRGTGKYAARYQNQARESLRECRPAIPAWIMPLHQVVSTVPMDTPGSFDVVIVDEASQCGPDALLLAWLGRRLVVVGDDKQVSPRNVGLDQEQVFTLQHRHLEPLPASRRNLFAPNNSLFDIASALAGSRGRLMLREHFRCMPEIIGFSNEHFYDGRLQPLRQYAADRLPPLHTEYVDSGALESRGSGQVNRAEAERLVERLGECCRDPAYRGRTLGVVTLLGDAQQALIERLVADRLSLEERIERRVRVGNPAAFQGDERDVMFLSAVYAPVGTDGEPRRAAPFSAEGYRQAINVAASRARDQVWFFHSFTLSDLGGTDLRRAYLDYLLRPAAEADAAGPVEVPADVRVDPFDNLFEQRVYRALTARGYRVRPQCPAGRHRIDLVVEGGTRRLAVECDGDAFHAGDTAADDADRQRELERVGWTFVRLRGSRFFRDPEEALRPLWKQLERMGIEPAGPGL
ncbi:AAA domain-containing protein [Nocardiopsis sp. CC223A]|uniref:AAA domain-containing protein n=1 Tax=Nocardiopsis sp. CC223A TaxID=3044051 RepID=UPI00278C611E|nr:AAA domain-containing protein [Nocardiopsis sp. CC223A]